MRKIELFHESEVLWQEDLPILRALNGRVPWNLRFGLGRMKVLSYDQHTDAGAYLMEWPEGYDPLGVHSHGGDESLLVLEGELLHDGKSLGPGTYFHAPKEIQHGPFIAGAGGCIFYTVVDGPLFSEEYVNDLLASGRAARHRA